jgi:hypothetical protein
MRLLGIVFVFFLSEFTLAQVVNIENKRIYDDTVGLSGSIAAAFNANKNQVWLVNASLRPQVQYKTKMHYFLLLGDLGYSRGADQTFANWGMLHFRYTYRLNFLPHHSYKSPWKWEFYTQVQYNQLLRQRMRAIAGMGPRLKIIEKNGVRMFVGTSVYYEHEELLDGITNKDFRSSTYLSWFVTFKDKLNFSGVSYYQPRVDLWSDSRFLGQYTLSYRLRKNFSIRWDATVYWDSDPALTVNKSAYNTTLGFQLGLN